jgi:hypothetical protein
MAKSDFMPKKDTAIATWHDCFTNALPALAAKYGISAGDLATNAAQNSAYKTDLGDALAKMDAAKAAVSTKDGSRDTAVSFSRAIARRIKAHPDYSSADGALLGIIGHERTVDLRTRAPHLTGRDVVRGRVELRFKKLSSDGIKLFCKRGEETAWTHIATHSRNKFFDDRPLLVAGKPELRIYRALYILRDENIGEYSQELEITCAP